MTTEMDTATHWTQTVRAAVRVALLAGGVHPSVVLAAVHNEILALREEAAKAKGATR